MFLFVRGRFFFFFSFFMARDARERRLACRTEKSRKKNWEKGKQNVIINPLQNTTARVSISLGTALDPWPAIMMKTTHTRTKSSEFHKSPAVLSISFTHTNFLQLPPQFFLHRLPAWTKRNVESIVKYGQQATQAKRRVEKGKGWAHRGRWDIRIPRRRCWETERIDNSDAARSRIELNALTTRVPTRDNTALQVGKVTGPFLNDAFSRSLTLPIGENSSGCVWVA